MTLDELYAKMAQKAAKAAIDQNINGRVLLDVTGGDPRRWLVSFQGGKVSVALAPEGAERELTLRCGAETLVKVATRQTSPVAAFMTGRIKISGDQSLAGQLKNIWPD